MNSVTRILLIIGLSTALSIIAGSAFAALCVWVNPDSRHQGLLPRREELHHRHPTIYTSDAEGRIEKRLGAQLDPDENEFKFYRVKKDGKP